MDASPVDSKFLQVESTSRKMSDMKKDKKMVVISIDVPEELRDKAKAAAEASDMTMAAWLRQLIRRGASAKLSAAQKEESAE